MTIYDGIPRLARLMHYQHKSGHSDDYRTLPRPEGSVSLVVRGGANYFTEGSVFRVEEGDILFIPVGGTYLSVWDDVPSEMYGFRFEMRNDFERRHLVQKIEGRAELFDIFHEIATTSTRKFRACELFYHVIDTFWDELETVETNINPAIRPALDFLGVSPERECSVSELAAMCHMSESRFFYCFKKSIGRAPMEYRTELLIMNAQRLLDSSELSISEVAERLGFGSETYFRRVFKAKVGVSPREFRKNPMR